MNDIIIQPLSDKEKKVLTDILDQLRGKTVDEKQKAFLVLPFSGGYHVSQDGHGNRWYEGSNGCLSYVPKVADVVIKRYGGYPEVYDEQGQMVVMMSTSRPGEIFIPISPSTGRNALFKGEEVVIANDLCDHQYLFVSIARGQLRSG